MIGRVTLSRETVKPGDDRAPTSRRTMEHQGMAGRKGARGNGGRPGAMGSPGPEGAIGKHGKWNGCKLDVPEGDWIPR